MILEVDFIDSVNIKKVDLDKEGLHLNINGKGRLELGFMLRPHLKNCSFAVTRSWVCE